MSSIITVLKKEWKCFTGSDRGVFFLYLILVLTWSFLLASGDNSAIHTGPLWLVFFSVVIAANFSNTVFISERVTGALEIMITSGLSRNGILFGKMIFVIIMSTAVGGICMGLGLLWHQLFYDFSGGFLTSSDFLVYVSSVFINVGSSAFLSVRMANPRMLHFTNLLLLGGIVSFYLAASQFLTLSPIYLVVLLASLGVLFSWLAKREFDSERILQPVIL